MSKFSNSLAALTPKRRDQVEAVPHAQDAMRAYQSAQEARRKLTVEGEELEKKRQAKERDLDDAALKRAEAAHEKLFEEHQKILRAIDMHERATRVADEKLKEAVRDMKNAGNAETRRAIERIMDARYEAADGIQTAVTDLVKHFRKYKEVSKDLNAIWPGGIAPLGVMSGQAELRTAVSIEFYRQHPTPPISGYGSGLPGANSGVSLGPVDKILSLVDRVTQAHARLFSELSNAFAKNSGEPTQIEELAAELDTPAETSRPQSADQIQSTIKSKRITMRNGQIVEQE